MQFGILTFFYAFTTIVFTFEKRAPLAQLVEQWTVNPCVAGSKPAGGGQLSQTDSCFLFNKQRCIVDTSGFEPELPREAESAQDVRASGKKPTPAWSGAEGSRRSESRE